jgi:hypothetical protein
MMYGGIDLHSDNSVVAVILKRSSAPMIWPPQMTTRDLVLMAGQSQSTTDRGRCCPTRIRLVSGSARRLIGKLATDKTKREIFARLANQIRVAYVERVVAQ